MSKTIIVGGFGPGISSAVAERFGAEGFSVALVGRNAERGAVGAKALTAKGVRAQAFTADLAKPDDIRAMVGKVRAAFGPISVVQWSAFAQGAGDLTTASEADLHGVLQIAIVGLVTAVQATLNDLRAEKGSVLVTNGGFGLFDPQLDALGAEFNAMGLSVANSAKHKAVAVLAHKLRPQDVYVGEVVVMGTVKGSAYDTNNSGTVDPKTVAAKFWELHHARTTTSATI